MTEKGKKTRAEILRAYSDIVHEEGVRTITVKKIAQRVGISPGNLNYYFKKKSDIGYALAGDLFAKTNIILSQDPHFVLTNLDKALLDIYITVMLHNRIMPLKNMALETATDPSIVDNLTNYLSDVFIKLFTKKRIQADNKTVTLATKTALMAFAFALKLTPSETTENYFVLTLNVFFSVLGFDPKPYMKRIMELKNMIDEDNVIQQIYSMQDYDYEIKEQ